MKNSASIERSVVIVSGSRFLMRDFFELIRFQIQCLTSGAQVPVIQSGKELRSEIFESLTWLSWPYSIDFIDGASLKAKEESDQGSSVLELRNADYFPIALLNFTGKVLGSLDEPFTDASQFYGEFCRWKAVNDKFLFDWVWLDHFNGLEVRRQTAKKFILNLGESMEKISDEQVMKEWSYTGRWIDS